MEIDTLNKTAKMDKELAKFGRPTGGASKGMVWTVGDLQRYFAHEDKKKKLDPHPTIKIRRKLIDKPAVKSFKDYKGNGLIRVLHRVDGSFFPEFALYVKLPPEKHRLHEAHDKMLTKAGLKEEGKGKWILRSDNLSLFVYV